MWKLHRDEIVQKMKEAQKRPEVIQRKSEIMKDRWKDDNFRTKKLEGASNVSRVNKISKSSKEMWKLHRDEIVQKMKEAQKRPEVIQRKSEIMKDRWKDDNFRTAHRNKMQELFSKEEWCKRINTYKTYSYSSKLYGNITLRSSYELRVCIMLDSLNIKYEYETKRFKYTYNGIERLYIVDFYLPDYDLYLEVKPKVFENDDKVLAKFNSVRKQGKNIIFIDEDCIYDTNKFNNIIITSTTI